MTSEARFDELLSQWGDLNAEEQDELTRLAGEHPERQKELQLYGCLANWAEFSLTVDPDEMADIVLKEKSLHDRKHLRLLKKVPVVAGTPRRDSRRRVALVALLICGASFAALTLPSLLNTAPPLPQQDDQSSSEETSASKAKAQLPQNQTTPAPSQTGNETVSVSRESVQVPTPQPSAKKIPTLAPPTPVTRAAPSPEELLRQARRATAEGKLTAAAQAYRTLQRHHPSNPAAHTTLVSLGKLEEKRGRTSSAEAAYRQYLSVGGALSYEAELGRIRTLKASGRTKEWQNAVDRFVQAYPQSAAAIQLRNKQKGD